MLFPTVEFCIFFLVVLPLSWALMPRPAAWKALLLVASYAFYAAADWRFCLLLAGLTVGNQLFARAIARTDSSTAASWLLGAAVGLDLGVLGTFKYYGFFVDQAAAVLDGVGLGMPLPLMTVALPIGISFITFQAISYVVDVKRGLLRPGALHDFALYLSFFPHLVAGPIVRAREFLPQLARPRDPHQVAVGAAVVLIIVGLTKKVVIADYLARTVVDPVFAVPEAYASPDILLAVYAYAAQIYCDFSGYTDMAIGLALLMGIRFPQNFHRPYSAQSFQDFWRRWHMTLSRYLRDYVYIPLGGNRHGPVRGAVNVFVTMVLGGLWHGAAWGFVLWGALHGTYLVVERILRARTAVRPPGWVQWFIVFNVVALTWVPFRAPDLTVCGELFQQLATAGPATLWTPLTTAAVLLVIAGQVIPERWSTSTTTRVQAWSPVRLGLALGVTSLLVAASIPSQGVPPFIYFQF